jgi:hypothetical protein
MALTTNREAGPVLDKFSIRPLLRHSMTPSKDDALDPDEPAKDTPALLKTACALEKRADGRSLLLRTVAGDVR